MSCDFFFFQEKTAYEVRISDWSSDVCSSDLERPDLASDPRFLTPDDRLANRDALTAELDGIFSRQPTAHWRALPEGHMPVAAVNSLDEALGNPFAIGSASCRARGCQYV